MNWGINWHPLIVHFPLALIVTAAGALSAARVVPNPRMAASLATVGTWNLCLGGLAVLFALGSGLAGVLDLHVSQAAHRAISSHVKSAVIATLLAWLVAVWRGAGTAADSRPTWMFILMLWAATAALVVTGYRGGQNVYRYGVGVATNTPAAPSAP